MLAALATWPTFTAITITRAFFAWRAICGRIGIDRIGRDGCGFINTHIARDLVWVGCAIFLRTWAAWRTTFTTLWAVAAFYSFTIATCALWT